MAEFSDVLRRLLESVPDVPEPTRREVERVGDGNALLDLFQRRAREALRSAQEQHHHLETLIRRS